MLVLGEFLRRFLEVSSHSWELHQLHDSYLGVAE